MQFDDRLATVLRMQAGNERSANTQYRQLLDLAGTAPENADNELLARAYARLEELSASIDADRRAEMIREPGMRLRSPGLVGFLARQELPVASAAMAAARLGESQWNALIPDLPIPARALLRHRKDLPASTSELLARLGVADLVLPQPPSDAEQAPAQVEEPVLDIDPDLAIGADGDDGIGALVRRIEAFQRAREAATAALRSDAPRLPLVEPQEDAAWLAGSAFDFATDTEGRITWADPAFAPMAVGLMLANRSPDAPARLGPRAIADFMNRQPIEAERITIDGAPAVAGEWQLDAAPLFAMSSGSFTGYRGRLRRPVEFRQISSRGPSSPSDTSADRMRQILHELRTPVNAIQGFAEIIQQQLFGPTPNEYRALAASIAGDAARMLAGFDEIDRLARLESGVLELEAGACDFRAIIAATVHQLESVLRQRTARFDLSLPGAMHDVALVQGEAEMLAWRVLATMAGATTPGEALRIGLTQAGGQVRLDADLPAALADREDVFASTAPAQAQSVSAGMFGAGFTLRLARAEARSAGGELAQNGEMLILQLPLSLGTSGDSGGNDLDSGDPMADTA